MGSLGTARFAQVRILSPAKEGSEKARAQGDGDRLCLVGGTELFDQMTGVLLDGSLGNTEDDSDLVGGLALSNPFKNLDFSWRQQPWAIVT